MLGKKYAYCPNCRTRIKNPKRKKLTSYNYQILIIASIATLGVGLVAFILYRLIFQKKKYCPECQSIVEFYKSPEEFPKKVAVKNLLERLEIERVKEKSKDEIKKEEDKVLLEDTYIICSFCGEKIEAGLDVCPFCGKEQKPS